MAKTWVEQAEVFEAEIYNDIVEHTIPRIAEQAMDVIIEAWNDGQGYESSGELVEWDQEKQPIMIDTGHLQANMSIKFKDSGENFGFFAQNTPYPERPDRSAAYISSIHEPFFPHLGVPKEYLPYSGDERKKMITEDVTNLAMDNIEKLKNIVMIAVQEAL